MSQSFSNILIHITFSTKNHHPSIKPDIQTELNRYISATARHLESPSIKTASVTDHVHVAVGLSRKMAISELVSKIKSSSSRWIKTKGDGFAGFQWQRGYGAFSVSHSVLQRVFRYLENQQEHHKRVSFKEEYLNFLNKCGIEYDERYVWD